MRSLAGFILICVLAQAAGAAATYPAIASGWYAGLAKPVWTPPAWLFGPVWTLLYLMIALAGWRIWQGRKTGDARPALIIFGVQLLLNSLWSFLFFGLRLPGAAFIEIVLLWLAILALMLTARRISGAAVLLLLPYLGWVGFAAALNFSIWRLNL